MYMFVDISFCRSYIYFMLSTELSSEISNQTYITNLDPK